MVQGPPIPGADQLPSPPELERMVQELGLAGTVKAVMQRTGWDFHTAAKYLTKTRRP